MTDVTNATPLGSGPDPIDVIACWPEDLPLAALVSGRDGSSFSRWSILSTPCGTRSCRGDEPDLAGTLDRLATDPDLPPATDPDVPPFRGGRLILLDYELGGILEPAAGTWAGTAPGRPVAQSLDCPVALVHDRVRDAWWVVGDLQDADRLIGLLDLGPARGSRPVVSPLEPELDDRSYGRLVERTVEYIHSGDVFQANITRPFAASCWLESRSSRRRLAADLLRASGAWFGGVLEVEGGCGDRTIVSLSPELFLEFDPVSRSIRSRPIKGTLPGGADPADLVGSSKDAAELAMIVDLMRNDLGRISDPGSVRVEEPRVIEHHPGVIHGVGTVRGTLRAGTGFGEILKSTFPPGSITGAPKIRAMQIIEEFEQSPRGAYCGAIGYSSRCGRMALDVSIRTLELERRPDRAGGYGGHSLRYGAGCGIVADSRPELEVQESRTKTALLARFIEECCDGTVDSTGAQEPVSPDSGERAWASS